MQKKNSNVAKRAWNLLRLALIWARKGGVFKRRLMTELRLLPKYLKSLRHSSAPRGAFHLGERELSFDDTPVFHVQMHRPASLRFRFPHIPCINPHVDFDFDFNGDNDEVTYDLVEARKSFLQAADEEECQGIDPCDDEEGIDLRAEEFIAKFYRQMKLQRQISYLQYAEMLDRGAS